MKISDYQQQRKNKRLCKILSVILVILMALTAVLYSASAATSWGLQNSQVSTGYFYAIGYGGSANYNWSIIRQRCFLQCKSLAEAYNRLVVDTSMNYNTVKQLDYCYNHGYSNQAVSLGNRWNNIYVNIIDSISDCAQLCGYGDSPQKVNNKEVTVDQYQLLYDQLMTQYNDLQSLADEARALYDMCLYQANDSLLDVYSSYGKMANRMWTILRQVIVNFGTGSETVNSFLGFSVSSSGIEQIANAISSITKTFAYAVAVVLFGVNITTTSLQNEILTLRGGIKIFARVLLVKFWIDLAIPICIYVLNIVNSLAKQVLNILSVSGGALVNTFDVNTNSHGVTDVIFSILRGILDFLTNFLIGLPSMIMLLVMIVCMIIVIVKMVARGFELTCLVSLSPIFFATLVGEESKRYFRRFISAFLSSAGYILFVAIVYAVGTKWVAASTVPSISSPLDVFKFILSYLPRCIIIVACCRVCIKPPKVLTSLFDGG